MFPSGKYIRGQVNSSQSNKESQKESLNELNKGQIIESKNIKFENVPIYTPNGDRLIEHMNIEVTLVILSPPHFSID